MTITDWAALLLADCSNTNLLGFADWLELDQDDEKLTQAARGVRELLVKEGRRPDDDTDSFDWWWGWSGDLKDACRLPDKVLDAIKKTPPYERCREFRVKVYGSREAAHLTAVLDAAQAWAKCNPEKKEQPQTVKGS